VAKQLQNEAKLTSQKRRGKDKKATQLNITDISSSDVVGKDEAAPSVSRSGRVRKQPQHLQGFLL
jgi:hypothetical protein